MNERYLHLDEQAYQYAIAESAKMASRPPVGSALFAEIQKAKFAELIIRECSTVITSLPDKMVDMELGKYNEGWRNGRLLAKEHIEKHFGVE